MAFLVFAVVASAVGIALVLLRNRRPTTMESSIGEFERGLRALAPEVSSATTAREDARAQGAGPDGGGGEPRSRGAGRTG